MAEEEKKEVLGQEKDMDANELDAVAGGGSCGCVLGGGGAADEWSKACVCVAGGGGEYTDEGASYWGKCRCACPLVGGGTGADYIIGSPSSK